MKANVYGMVVGLQQYIEDNLPSALRDVEAEISDEVGLPDPKLYSIGYQDLFSSNSYPLLCCVAGSLTVEDAAMHAQVLDLTVSVLVSFVHQKPAVLEEILVRYADAFLNTLGVDESIGGVCQYSRITDIDWGHPRW